MVCRALVVLLLVLLEAFLDSRAQRSTGLMFVIVLPENVAYYYPSDPEHTLYFTSLGNNNTIVLRAETGEIGTWTMQVGDIEQYKLTINHADLNMGKLQQSKNVLQISSTKPITVEVVSRLKSMAQSLLVLSVDQLGTYYSIPSLKSFPHGNHPLRISNAIMTERSALRVIVVNTHQTNKVQLVGFNKNSVLEAHQAHQIYLDPEEDLLAIRAEHPVAVLISHTCAREGQCHCRMLFTALPPETSQHQTFLIPSTLPTISVSKNAVLLFNKESTTIKPYNAESPILSISGNAIFCLANFLLPLIPVESFATCYTLHGYPDTETSAVIIVHQDQTGGVRLGNDPPQSPDWKRISGTSYVSSRISLNKGKNIIWHVSTKMGVYHIGKFQGTWFGNTAPVISRTPDPRGCVLIPENFEIGSEPAGWRESNAYCKNKSMELASFSHNVDKELIHQRITEAKMDGLKQVWIGMRLGLRTGKFYWIKKEPLTAMDWSEGQPGMIIDRQCVAMSVEEGFGWMTENCCVEMHPVCYRCPVMLPL